MPVEVWDAAPSEAPNKPFLKKALISSVYEDGAKGFLKTQAGSFSLALEVDNFRVSGGWNEAEGRPYHFVQGPDHQEPVVVRKGEHVVLFEYHPRTDVVFKAKQLLSSSVRIQW